MAESGFYGADGYEGYMKNDGTFYDANNQLMGRVADDGTIYNNSNLPVGRITDDGRLYDVYNHMVGQEIGDNFCSTGVIRSMGRASTLTPGEGRGRDYGAFHMLNRCNRDSSFPHPWGEPSYYDGSDGDEGADEFPAPEESALDDWEEPPPAPRASWSNRRGGGYGGSGISSDAAELLNGCLSGIIILFVLIGIIVGSCSSS